MKKSNTFKLGVAIVAILIVAAGYFAINNFMSGQKGSKTIIVTIKDSTTSKTLVDSKKYKTDAANLGDFLAQYKDELGVQMETSKYGRFVVGLKGIKTEDMNKGPWWMYGYESPSQNITMKVGEAPGVDTLGINDKDKVEFVFMNFAAK